MRSMACHTALFLHWRVLKDKRSGCIDVAFRAYQGLPRGCLQVVRQKGPMRIVAIRTRHKTFVYPVMLRFGEIRRDVSMAAVTQRRLSRHQQIMLDFRRVNGVTGCASHAIGQMWRSHEILMTFVLLVARQAPLARLLCIEGRESDDFCGIAS